MEFSKKIVWGKSKNQQGFEKAYNEIVEMSSRQLYEKMKTRKSENKPEDIDYTCKHICRYYEKVMDDYTNVWNDKKREIFDNAPSDLCRVLLSVIGLLSGYLLTCNEYFYVEKEMVHILSDKLENTDFKYLRKHKDWHENINYVLKKEEMKNINEYKNKLKKAKKYKICEYHDDDNLMNSIPKEEGVYRIVMPNGFKCKISKKTKSYNTINNKSMIYKNLQEKYDELANNWTKDKEVLYIGKAKNLNNRLKQYIKYGYKECKVHRGGRAIWQLENCYDLEIEYVLCKNSRDMEKMLIADFNEENGNKPFGNRCG